MPAQGIESGRILVTGASGFIGSHVCRDLLRNGCEVRGLVRPNSRLVGTGVEMVQVAGLLDRDALQRAVRGVSTVIHLAGRVHVRRDTTGDLLGTFRSVNVDGTRVLLEEAISGGVDVFVFVSSLAAVTSQSAKVVSDTTPLAPASRYGVSKLEAELLVRKLAKQAGMRACILRPPLVYGAGMKGSPLRLFDVVARGVPLPLRSIDNRRSLIFVGNLVAAIRAIASTPDASEESFFVSDCADISTPELVRAVAHALGRTARLIPAPQAVLRLAGYVGDLISPVLPFPLTSDDVTGLLGSLVVDASRIMSVTGFRPPYSLEEGMQQTAEWYLSRETGMS